VATLERQEKELKIMNKTKSEPIYIPNWLLACAAAGQFALALFLYVQGSYSAAIIMFGGAGVCLSALNFSYPKLSLSAKLALTPILLAPFAAIGLIAIQMLFLGAEG